MGGMIIFAICFFGILLVFAVVKGVVDIYTQHAAREQSKTKALELKAKVLEEERQIREEERKKQEEERKMREVDAMMSSFKRAVDLTHKAMRQMDEIWRRADDMWRGADERGRMEHWQSVAVGVKVALVLLGHAERQRWEQEDRVKEVLDIVIRRDEEEGDEAESEASSAPTES